MTPHDYDPLRGDGAENVPVIPAEEWHARESAGANLLGWGACALIVAILVYTALRQLTG